MSALLLARICTKLKRSRVKRKSNPQFRWMLSVLVWGTMKSETANPAFAFNLPLLMISIYPYL